MPIHILKSHNRYCYNWIMTCSPPNAHRECAWRMPTTRVVLVVTMVRGMMGSVPTKSAGMVDISAQWFYLYQCLIPLFPLNVTEANNLMHLTPTPIHSWNPLLMSQYKGTHFYFMVVMVRELCERTDFCCHWSWSKGTGPRGQRCWLKERKVKVVGGPQSNHISGSKICTHQCQPGVCWEHANYPGGDIGRTVTDTFHECRFGE